MKKIGIVVLVIFIAFAGVVYWFRYDIFQFSAESIIKGMLPEYVSVDRIVFDLKDGVMQVKGFGIRNPKGFENKFLASIKFITCKYKMQGKTILDGIEVTDIEATGPVINIERLSDGQLNVNEMGKMMESGPPGKPVKPKAEKKGKAASGGVISDMIKLTNTINVNDGKLALLDKAVSRRPFHLTFENANGNVVLDLSKDYTDVLSVATKGGGLVNGDRAQKIDWTITLDPQTQNLTMGNRFEVNNVDITLFKPYYDTYSPINIKSGRFSGTLVFDFDNGNIGSMNTIVLRNLRFTEKKGGTASGFWDMSVSDMIKYLETSSGEIVFDFKIKGDMKNPRFYPGPHVKQAIQGMVVDKVSELLTPEGGSVGEAAKSDTEKVVDVIRGLLKK